MNWGVPKVHAIVGGNVKQVHQIQQSERRRAWFIFLDFVAVVFIFMGVKRVFGLGTLWFYFSNQFTLGIVFIAVGLLIFAYFILRKVMRRHRHRNHHHRHRHH